jgi:phospholipase C
MRTSRGRLVAALAAVGLVVSACSGAGSREAPLPPHVDATRFTTRWPIKHVVFIIKENRSFDHMFGLFPGVNSVRVANDHGVMRPMTKAEDQRAHDLTHCYACAVAAIDAGRMDGFNQSVWDDKYAFTQFRPNQLPNYWHWAQQNVLMDNFFASATGPSFPNHLYSIAAQSGGALDNPVQDPGLLQQRLRNGFAKSWGCDIVQPGAYVEILDPEGKLIKVDPCFDFTTEGDLLRKAGIPWAYYAATNRQLGYIWSAYSAIDRYRNDPELWNRYIRGVDDVVRDIEQDRLPPVTWVTPRFQLSEHPEYNFCYGENWTTKVIDAIMNSPMWKDTAIFVTWDDYGGFYDHVKPIEVDPFGLGIRVPMLIISPYAKQGFVDHTEGEFSSVLRFIEDNWGLSRLTDRDRKADNLSEAFDFTQTPRAPDPLPLRTDCKGPIWAPPPPDSS